MKKDSAQIRTVVLVVAVSLIVVLLIALVASLSAKTGDKTGIKLPTGSSNTGETEIFDDLSDGFVTLTTKNVTKVIASLERPGAYHQIFTRSVSSTADVNESVVQIWSCDGVQKIIITDSSEICHILTDGKTAYLWYEDDRQLVTILQTPQEVSVDDLAGILTYESYTSYPQDRITAAEYQQMTDQDGVSCIYFAAQETSGDETRIWVDVNTGLLNKAECLADGVQYYKLSQLEQNLLTRADAALRQQLTLPNGTMPFAIAAE